MADQLHSLVYRVQQAADQLKGKTFNTRHVLKLLAENGVECTEVVRATTSTTLKRLATKYGTLEIVMPGRGRSPTVYRHVDSQADFVLCEPKPTKPDNAKLAEQVMALESMTSIMLEYFAEGSIERGVWASHELARRATKTDFAAIIAALKECA